MRVTAPLQRRDLLALLFILCVAAFMRVNQAGIVEFFHDDAMLASLAQDMVAGEGVPLTGINSSVGIPNPPTSVYMLALPFAISMQPHVAVAYVMLLNVLGVGLLWWLARRYFGFGVALVAGWAYALSPWAVVYSRKIWAQEFHTPLILLALILGLYGYMENGGGRGRWIAQALCLPILLFAMQIHFAAWLLMPLYMAFLWLGRRNIKYGAFAMSLLLGGLVLAPYAIGLAQTLQADPTRITDAIGRSDAQEGLSFTADALKYAFYLTTGLGLGGWLAPEQEADLLANTPQLTALWVIFAMLASIGVAVITRGKRYGTGWRMLFFGWLVLPLAAFIPNWTPVYGHYFIPMLPALMLLIGVGAMWLLDYAPNLLPANHKIWMYGSTLALVTLGLTQAVWWHAALQYVDTHEIAYPGFTTPLHDLETIHADLATYDDVVVVSQGMWWLTHHESIVWSTLLRDTTTCVRTIKGDGYAVLPAHPFAVLIAPDAPPNPVDDFYMMTDAPQLFPTRLNAKPYEMYTFEAAPEWSTLFEAIDPVTFDGAVQLTGYALADERVTLRWTLPARNPDVNYQYGVQVLDAAGNKLDQRDTLFWYGRHWCAGDTLITWTDMPAPDAATTLRISLYSLGAGKDAGQYFSANVLDAAGNPAGNWVDIPLR